MQLSDTAGALADAEMHHRLTGARLFVVTAGFVAAIRGDTAETRRALERVRREAPEDWAAQATLLVALNRRDQAIRLLEEMRHLGTSLWTALRDPELDSLRSDARFQRLFDEVRPR